MTIKTRIQTKNTSENTNNYHYFDMVQSIVILEDHKMIALNDFLWLIKTRALYHQIISKEENKSQNMKPKS